MKKKAFSKKLNLNKETVSALNDQSLGNVKGGERAQPFPTDRCWDDWHSECASKCCGPQLTNIYNCTDIDTSATHDLLKPYY